MSFITYIICTGLLVLGAITGDSSFESTALLLTLMTISAIGSDHFYAKGE